MQYPSLEAWWHFPGWVLVESFVYLWFVGVFTTALVALIWLGAWAVSKARVSGMWPVARYATLLVIAAYVCGAPANLLFTAVFRYHAYVPGDPIVDWLPFIPTGKWVVDSSFNGRFINGGSPYTLRVAWAVLAVPVWAAAIWAAGRFTSRQSAPAQVPKRAV